VRLRVHVCAFVRVFVCVRVRTKRITEGREELYGLTLLRRSTRSRVERDARSLTSDRCIHSPALSRTLSRTCNIASGICVNLLDVPVLSTCGFSGGFCSCPFSFVPRATRVCLEVIINGHMTRAPRRHTRAGEFFSFFSFEFVSSCEFAR